jgi:predicted small secreted protein
MNPIFLPKSNTCGLPGKAIATWPAWIAALLLLGASVGLTSCRTARGFGDDVQHVGEKIEDAATR